MIDGDTLRLSDGSKVRLIGVDTPEIHTSDKLYRDARRTRRDAAAIKKMGQTAFSFTRSLCEGKNVRLEFDAQKKDRYKRLLAYAYLEDGTFVNAKILEEGYGQVMTVSPNVKHVEYFLKLQRAAREKKKGLWARADFI